MSVLRRRILIIDNDSENIRSLSDILCNEYIVIAARSSEEGLNAARNERPDLILIEILTACMDGAQTCEKLRTAEVTRHIPVIAMMGSANSQLRIEAFLSGADDVVIKPCEGNELLARIQSKMRRIQERESASQIIQCGNLTLDLQAYEVKINDRPISISVLEFNLLRYFIENRNRVINRQTILDAVWKDSVVSDRTVDTHMASLRKKLVGFDHNFTTIYSAGYILKGNRPETTRERVASEMVVPAGIEPATKL